MSRGVRIAGVAVMLSLFSMFWRGRTACFSVVFLRTGLVCGGCPRAVRTGCALKGMDTPRRAARMRPDALALGSTCWYLLDDCLMFA